MKLGCIGVIAVCAAMAACGGGGSSNTVTTTSVAPAPTPAQSLVSSGGDLTKYTGRWVSSCGVTVFEPKGVINTYAFGTPVGSSVSGTFISQSYTSLNCTGSPISAFPPSLAITLTFVASMPVTSGSPASAAGNADRASIAVAGSSLVTQTYAFFPDLRTFEVGGDAAFFSIASLPYKKQ